MDKQKHAHWIFKHLRSGGWRRRKCIDVKTGEPVEVFVDEREDDMEPYCSACGVHNEGDIDNNMNYCPHCGAKMEGDAREEYWQAYLAVIGVEKFREAGIIDGTECCPPITRDEE
jgi:hypothetical protein|nr:MAG TPA: DNA-directed RNA polymerase II subunit [Caudoviricetes sp.]